MFVKIDWDAALPDEINNQWKSIIDDIESVSEIELPRSLLSNTQRDKIRRVELHGFSDAGKVAYGAKVYIRIETDDGFSSSLVASKSRITPLKEETVPHLELLGALLLAELITSVRNALKSLIKVDGINCWSDSQIFL